MLGDSGLNKPSGFYRTIDDPRAAAVDAASKKTEVSKPNSESKAVALANRVFTNPAMMRPTIDEKVFTFVDVGAKIPNYTPGRQWGALGAPLTEMQKPLPAETSIKGYSVPQSFSLSLWAKESNEYWPEESLGAKFAIDANSKQIRYVKIPIASDKPLKSIEFIKGGDFSFPLIFAVTVESANSDAH